MSVRLDGQVIRLEGECRVEAAESLAALLHGAEGRTVELSHCRILHGAVVQVLLAYGVPVVGPPADPFLRDLVFPALGDSSSFGQPSVAMGS